MRKWTLFLGAYFAVCVLAACAAGGMDMEAAEPPAADRERPAISTPEAEAVPEGRGALYLQVLDDLWNVDKGLNEHIDLVGVDLSGTGLTEGEQAAVALVFAQRHGVALVQGTAEDLEAQGYITREEGFPHWENGCLFTLSETESSDRAVTFQAAKWRSALGAYAFVDCAAEPDGAGRWSTYTVGAEAIS